MTGLKNIIRSMKGNKSLYSSLLLQTVVIVIYLSTISAEVFQPLPDASSTNESPQHNSNQVTTYDECKRYLCKYGYLTCDCRDTLERRKRQLPVGMSPVESDFEFDPPSVSSSEPTDTGSAPLYSPRSVCTPHDFITALQTFQKNYKLSASGVCDEMTANQMSQRRCGQPDTVIDKLDEVEETLPSRQARSLTDLISDSAELDESAERRKEQLKEYIEDIQREKFLEQAGFKPKRRDRRSQMYSMVTDYGPFLNKRQLSWRLMSEHVNSLIPHDSQRSILRQAFRYWSEIAPLCFYEDKDAHDVDIQIGFLEGVHLTCYRQFDGYGGEIAHKFYRDVHFDNSEPYTAEVTDGSRLSLLLVAVHEIGHVLGLNHSDVGDSIMNAIYHRVIRGRFELSNHDRMEVKRSYGPCNGRFDTIFDYVRTSTKGGQQIRIYSSFFFRDNHYWKYENSKQRARFGYPMNIQSHWQSLLESVDTFMHYWEYNTATATFTDQYIFFKGDKYHSYNSLPRGIVQSGSISERFLPYNSVNRTARIPNNLDAAFFDYRANVKLVYFFKDDKVYSYNYRLSGTHKCCEDILPITRLYPPTTLSDLTSPDGVSYASNIDVVYVSNHRQAMYFIKGDDVWQNQYFYNQTHGNSMTYLGKWYYLWSFICDGECT